MKLLTIGDVLAGRGLALYSTHLLDDTRGFGGICLVLSWSPLGVAVNSWHKGFKRSPEEMEKITARLREFICEGEQILEKYCEGVPK